MRADAISQIISYTQNELKKMESLIEENEGLQVSLVKKQNDLNEKITLSAFGDWIGSNSSKNINELINIIKKYT